MRNAKEIHDTSEELLTITVVENLCVESLMSSINTIYWPEDNYTKES